MDDPDDDRGGDQADLPENPIFPSTTAGIPRAHPLRRFFRSVTRKAFQRFHGIYHPAVEVHISEEVLSEFVHMDHIHRIRDRDGQRLTRFSDVATAARTSGPADGVERDLELHQHTGDFALFIAGLFPEALDKRCPSEQQPLLACVGSTVVRLDRARDYYIVEGRSAYSYVARLYSRLNPERSGVFDRLSNRFEDYLDLMECIKGFLSEASGASTGRDAAGHDDVI